MSDSDKELQRLIRLRQQQLAARDPHAKERKAQARITARRKKMRKDEHFFRDAAGDVSHKWRGLLVGAILGLAALIALPIFVQAEWTELVGCAAIPFFSVLGFLFGASFDWRDEIRESLR